MVQLVRTTGMSLPCGRTSETLRTSRPARKYKNHVPELGHQVTLADSDFEVRAVCAIKKSATNRL
eukprot:5577730-Amphidinium_carterae.1